MSFRQDRTNPSTAVSNWKGRSETPKGHPSTRVSQWINGGIFGGGAADTWFSVYSWDSDWNNSQGAKYPTTARPWEDAKNTPLTSDGSVVMMCQSGSNSFAIHYQIAPDGTITPNAAQIGQYFITNGEYQSYSSTTNGTNLLLIGGYTKYTPDSAYRQMPSVTVVPLSDLSTSGTPTIEAFAGYQVTAGSGSGWSNDRFRSLMVYNDDIAGSNTVYWCLGGKPTGKTGWVFGTYNVATDTLACTGSGRMYGSDWDDARTDWTSLGGSGRMYGWTQGSQRSPAVFMSDATSEASSWAYEKGRAQAWKKTTTYSGAYGQCFGAYYCGQYSGNDQFYVMYSVQHLYGGAETYIAKMTPYDGAVQDTILIYALNGQGSMHPPNLESATGFVMDSSNNLYCVMERTGNKSNSEIVVMKLNDDLDVQWTRVMQVTDNATWNGFTSGQHQLYAGGINLSADEQYLVVHGTLEYYPSGGQRAKGVAFRVKADGSGAIANDATAVKIGSGGFSTPTVSNDYSWNAYVRYYDPADTSASPNPRSVNVTSFGGNWGSSSCNMNSEFSGNTGAANVGTLTKSNKAAAYGNYVYENTFPG